jgi:GNAT superfamily N-acetyltransferase
MSGSPSGLRIESAWEGRPFKDFLHLPYRIYDGDPNWVAPLLRDVKTMFDREKHPFHQHSDVEPFVAYRDGEAVGRIVAIHNKNHVAFHDEPVGFFGFFECEDRQGTADLLLDMAGDWLRARGLEIMRGPTRFSTTAAAGLLVDGFDCPPVVMVPYNPPYYTCLLENAGFVVAKNLVALFLVQGQVPEFLAKREKRLAERLKVNIRHIDIDRFDEELETVRVIYNSAWEKNWGFVPMTAAEIHHMAGELKPVVKQDPEQVLIVEDTAGKAIGFALWLKDYNRALIHARGRLFPFGLLKILWYARKIRMLRVLTLGLIPEYRGKGIDSLIYIRIFNDGHAKGIDQGEFSWVLEDNMPMMRPLEKMGAHPYKRYRILDRPL